MVTHGGCVRCFHGNEPSRCPACEEQSTFMLEAVETLLGPVVVPSIFELHGEVIDAEAVRWAISRPALTEYFREYLLRWVADAMDRGAEGSSIILDKDKD